MSEDELEFDENILPTTGHEELLKELEEIGEKELEYLEMLEKRVAKEISIHHRDLHSVFKDAAKNYKDVLENLGKLESEKSEEVEKKIFEDISNVDTDITVSMLTTVAMMRYIAHYYLLRKKFSERFEKIVKDPEILKKDQAAIAHIDELVKSLAKATHSHIPAGPLINASWTLQKMLEAEGVESWVTRRRAGSKLTADKKEQI